MTGTLVVAGLSVPWTLIPVEALADLEPQWQESLSRASQDEVFRGYLAGHDFRVPESAVWATSVAIAVLPFAPRVIPFLFEGRQHTIVLPTPYYQHRVTRAMVGEHLAQSLAQEYGPTRVEVAPTLPYKPLAASCGLGQYGRNGLIYAEGLGTALSLAVFWTSVPAEPVPALSPAALPHCASCGACFRQCPTGAIPAQAGPICVDRCVPLWNELDRDLPASFPTHVSNALVGCLACQCCCPANDDYFAEAEWLPELTEAETGLLLQGTWQPALRDLLARILSYREEDTLREMAPVLRRNLAAYLRAEPQQSPCPNRSRHDPSAPQVLPGPSGPVLGHLGPG